MQVFFFHGRLICGPDPRGLMLTTVSILLSSWIFTIYVGEDLLSHSRLIIIIISMILTIIVRLLTPYIKLPFSFSFFKIFIIIVIKDNSIVSCIYNKLMLGIMIRVLYVDLDP
jgi:uncharacterized membrane protein YjjP (DUF1212 family)